jgi:signal transduction histidine kinase
LKVALAVGGAATTLSDDWYPLANTVAEDVMGSGRAALVDDASVDGRKIAVAERVSVGPVMVLPLVGSARVRGVLDVGRLRGRARFSAADLEMAATFAAHASLAMELAEARRDQQRSFLLEDRARIARDLHDHVIQQLFAAGLTVQGVASGIGDENTAGMLERVVDALDDSIKQIRTSIFQLKPQASGAVGGLRTSVLQVIDEVGQLLGIQPEVGFVGPVDTLADAGLADDVVAVVREALSNVAKHADASKVGVHVRTTTSTLEVVVTDDGRGIGSSMRRSGLANIRRRAERRYGRVTVNEPAPQSGTTLRWTVPLR